MIIGATREWKTFSGSFFFLKSRSIFSGADFGKLMTYFLSNSEYMRIHANICEYHIHLLVPSLPILCAIFVGTQISDRQVLRPHLDISEIRFAAPGVYVKQQQVWR